MALSKSRKSSAKILAAVTTISTTLTVASQKALGAKGMLSSENVEKLSFKFGNFLKNNYDWLIPLIGIVVISGIVVVMLCREKKEDHQKKDKQEFSIDYGNEEIIIRNNKFVTTGMFYNEEKEPDFVEEGSDIIVNFDLVSDIFRKLSEKFKYLTYSDDYILFISGYLGCKYDKIKYNKENATFTAIDENNKVLGCFSLKDKENEKSKLTILIILLMIVMSNSFLAAA